MKITTLTICAWCAQALVLMADDVTRFSGTAMCAKCELGQKDECQMAIKVKNTDGKEETLFVENNKIAKDFHDKICKKNLPINATGIITPQASGEKIVTLESIYEAKS